MLILWQTSDTGPRRLAQAAGHLLESVPELLHGAILLLHVALGISFEEMDSSET